MKKIALIPVLALITFALNSCCSGWKKPQYVEQEVTEWVDQEVFVPGSGKSKGGTVTQSVPVTKIVKTKKKCARCITFWCPDGGCCGTTGDGVYSRVTSQGGTGEPHIGLIPSMRVLAE